MTRLSRQLAARLAATATAILSPGAAHALTSSRAAPHAVSCAEARALVMAAQPARVLRLPEVEPDPHCPAREGTFRHFTVVWAGVPGGSVVVGNFAVDVRTADVWDAVIECTELRTPALRTLQARVRARLGLSAARYRMLRQHHRGPMCEEAAGTAGSAALPAAAPETAQAESGAGAG